MNKPDIQRSQPPTLRVIERDRPHNRRAEQIVLGTLINFPAKIEEVMGILHPQDFYVDRHRTIYELMLAHYRKRGYGADALVLADAMERRQKQEDVIDDLGTEDLAELMYLSNELWSIDLMQDVRLITGPAAQRRHIDASLALATIGYSITDPEEARTAVEKLLYDLTMVNAPASDFESAGDITAENLIEADYAQKRRGQILGIPTGYNDLDLMTDGFQRSDLILLGGRPSMGKTALGMGIAYNAAKRGFSVAVFSLEMGKRALGRRLLSLVARRPSNQIRAGWLEQEDMDELVKAQSHISDLSLYIDDTSGAPISSIRSKLHRLRARTKRAPDLVVVDYVGLMEDESADNKHRSQNRNEEISHISRGLKAIAREFDVPILALAQLSRGLESRQSKIPQLSDLRESGSLEQDADIVAFVYRDEYYNPNSERKGSADIVVAKNRNGAVGTFTLHFNGALTRFDNFEDTVAEDE